tara:strand:- start:43 stop:510 length:468 start_codon:yes stop_codon:yes gene_type:complete
MSTIKVDTYLTRGGASEIAIDKLKGASSAGSMTVVGEGGSTTTNLQQGLAKSWLNYNHPSAAVRDSLNVGSVTDNATGHFTKNYTNNMNGDYAVSCNSAETAGSGPDSDRYITLARGANRLSSDSTQFSAGDVSDQMSTLRDQNIATTLSFGDLA